MKELDKRKTRGEKNYDDDKSISADDWRNIFSLHSRASSSSASFELDKLIYDRQQ